MKRALGRRGAVGDSMIAGLALLVSLLVSAPFARAAEGLEAANLGPLAGVVSLEENGPWAASVEEGYYTLANASAPGSIRFFYLGADAATAGRRRLSVRVRVEGGEEGGLAGLLYGHRADPLFYYAFGLTDDGRTTLYRRDADGIAPVIETQLGEEAPREVLLAIEEQGEDIRLLVDGEEVGRFAGEGTGGGGIGIIAMGKGRFGFRDFAVTAAPAEQTADTGPEPSPPPETPVAASDFGPLAGVLAAGETGVWRYGVEDGAFVLRNRTDAERFLRFSTDTPEPEGRRLVRTTFTMDSDPGTRGAGLAYADADDRAFFVLWTPDDRVRLERLEGGRTVLLRAWQVKEQDPGSRQLWLAEDGDIIVLGFDSEPLGFVQNPEFGRGKVGIVAYGTGTFRFTGFDTEVLTEVATPLPVTPPAEPPAGPGAPSEPPAAPPQPPPGPGQPGPWGQPPQPQQPGPWGQPPQQPGPWGQPPQPQQPGPWGQPPQPQQPGPWGQPPQPQPPGPWGQPPQPQHPGPWGQPPQPQQPGPWGQPPQQQPPPADRAALERAIGDIATLARALTEQLAGRNPAPPKPPKGWRRYTDPSVPMVLVNHPEGWSVRSVAQRSAYGTLPAVADLGVVSPDGLHELAASSFFGVRGYPVEPEEALEEIVAKLTGGREPEEILREERFTAGTEAPGSMPVNGAFAAYRFGDRVIAAYAATGNLPAGNTFSVLARARAIVGPADRFVQMTTQVYIPLLNSTAGW